MRKWGLLALCLLMALTPVARAEDDLTQIMAQLELIDGATPLLSMVASAVRRTCADLSGAPDASLAWDVLGQCINGRADHRERPFSADELAELYASLFAEGEFSDIEAADCAPFERVEGGYQYAYGDGDPWEVAVENAYEAQPDGSLLLDLSIYTDSNGAGQWFCFNATGVIVPDAEAAYGAKVSLLQRSKAALPMASGAEATAELKAVDSIGYSAGNVLDGDLHTCWAYDGSRGSASVELRFVKPAEVRGLAIAAGCMRSAELFDVHGKPAQLTIRMSNGATRSFDLRDVGLAYDCMIVLPFGEVETVTGIVVDVDEVLQGTCGHDVCISEIGVF